LKDVIERQGQDNASEWVFCTARGEKLTLLTNAFWNAVKEAKLIWAEAEGDKVKKTRFRFHDLRHTFGARLGMAGVDLKTIMEIMGHKSHKVAMWYQHPTADHKLKAVKILDQVPLIFTTEKNKALELRVVSNG